MSTTVRSSIFLCLLVGCSFAQILPSRFEKLTCTGFDYCADRNCTTFVRGNTTFRMQRYFPNQANTASCDSLAAQYEYDETADPNYLGNVTWNCTTYGNGNKTFTVMEMRVSKLPNASVVTCTYQGHKFCTVLSNTSKESRFLLGMPDNCTAYVERTTTTWAEFNTTRGVTTSGPTTSASNFLPSGTENIVCPGLDYCYGQRCVFTKRSSGFYSQIFIPNNWHVAFCHQVTIQFKYQETVEPNYLGNASWNCITYGNRFKNFTVLELNVPKSDMDQPYDQIICNYKDDQNKTCTVLEDTSEETRFLAGMPSQNCYPYFGPTGTTDTEPITTNDYGMPVLFRFLDFDVAYRKDVKDGRESFDFSLKLSRRPDN